MNKLYYFRGARKYQLKMLRTLFYVTGYGLKSYIRDYGEDYRVLTPIGCPHCQGDMLFSWGPKAIAVGNKGIYMCGDCGKESEVRDCYTRPFITHWNPSLTKTNKQV